MTIRTSLSAFYPINKSQPVSTLSKLKLEYIRHRPFWKAWLPMMASTVNNDIDGLTKRKSATPTLLGNKSSVSCHWKKKHHHHFYWEWNCPRATEQDKYFLLIRLQGEFLNFAHIAFFIEKFVREHPYNHLRLRASRFTDEIQSTICNGNTTEWSPIQSVIIRVITKSDSRCAVVRFVYHEYDYRLY